MFVAKPSQFFYKNKRRQTGRALLIASLSLAIRLFRRSWRTRSKTLEIFLDSKSLFWRKEWTRWMGKSFLWTWWGWSWILLQASSYGPERFEHSFNLVASLITKQDMNYWNCIPAKKPLVTTLRYLAGGYSQQALSLSFRVGKSTVPKQEDFTWQEIWQTAIHLIKVRWNDRLVNYFALMYHYGINTNALHLTFSGAGFWSFRIKC